MNTKELLPLTQSLNILYAEDDEILREASSELFKNFFASIDVAQDGKEAWEMYQEKSYDIIISDILMPYMTGLELAEKIKSHDPEQHIIFISAYNDAAYFEQSISLGIDGYIVKPLNHTQLVTSLYKIAKKIKEHRENIAYKHYLEAEIEDRTKEIKKALISDTLTKLPNRLALEQDLTKGNHYGAILFNIDNFSSVNIGFGYEIGDALLIEVCRFLQASLPKDITLYRIGSDEFLAISSQPHITHLNDIARDIQNRFINTILSLPHDLTLRLTMTIAVAESSAKNLVRNIELALHEARKAGKNQIFTYDDQLPINSLQKERIEWINKVRLALEHDLLVPFFQPIIHNSSKKITKYESLARIIEKDNTIITPNFFIEPARMSGQISEVTKVMIRKTMQAFSTNNYEFSINIESEDLNAKFLPDYIKHYAQKYKINMNRIVLEILEHIQTSDEENTISQISHLKEMGIQIAIDDFGNEQSNFSRLLDIQADYIKIDGQFIKFIDSDLKSYKISSAITKLAKSLDAQIIAEFVHSQDVLDKIIDLNIDFSQGYLFGPPEKNVK